MRGVLLTLCLLFTTGVLTQSSVQEDSSQDASPVDRSQRKGSRKGRKKETEEKDGLVLRSCTRWPEYVTENDASACTCSMAAPRVLQSGEVLTLHWRDADGHALTTASTNGGAGLRRLKLPLNTERLSHSTEGQNFTCVFTDQGQKINSVVYRVPPLAFGPENVTITGPAGYLPQNGANVTLTCTAISNPAPLFEWPNEPVGAVVSKVLQRGPETYSQTLTFDPSGYSDGDRILCDVRNPQVPPNEEQTQFRLTIKRKAVLEDCIRAPRYLTHTHKYACTCSFTPLHLTSNWTLSWFDPRGRQLLKKACNSKTMTLPLPTSLIQPLDTGNQFTCLVTNEDGEYSKARFYPQVAYGPVDMLVTSPTMLMPEDESLATLTCSAHGNPILQFDWRHQSPDAVRGYINHLGNYTYSQSLTFDPRNYSDGDVITCVATNPEQPSMHQEYDYHLVFQRRPDLEECVSNSEFITPDNTSACTCTFLIPDHPLTDQHFNNWTLTWTDPLGLPMNSTADHNNVTIATNATFLTLPLVASLIEPQDSGRVFHCVVSTEDGEFSRTPYVPHIAYGPEYVSVLGGETEDAENGTQVTVLCVVENASPPPVFEWLGVPPNVTDTDCTTAITPDVYCRHVSIDAADISEGDVITCSVWNPRMLGVKIQASYTVPSNYAYVAMGVLAGIAALLGISVLCMGAYIYCSRPTAPLRGPGAEQRETDETQLITGSEVEKPFYKTFTERLTGGKGGNSTQGGGSGGDGGGVGGVGDAGSGEAAAPPVNP